MGEVKNLAASETFDKKRFLTLLKKKNRKNISRNSRQAKSGQAYQSEGGGGEESPTSPMLTSSHPESCFCSSNICFTRFFAASFTSPSRRCSCFTYNPHSGICVDKKLANYSAGLSKFSGGPFS